MRIIALLGDRVGDPLHTNREKIEISQVLIEILGFEILVVVLTISREGLLLLNTLAGTIN